MTMCRCGVCTQVSRQLFQPLVFQLIHWLTNAQSENQETIALLEAIADSVSDPSDGALREFSSKVSLVPLFACGGR